MSPVYEQNAVHLLRTPAPLRAALEAQVRQVGLARRPAVSYAKDQVES